MNGFPEQILLATDGLVSMVAAARAAVHLTEKGGAELHLVHVWHTVPSPHFDRVIRSGVERFTREPRRTRRLRRTGPGRRRGRKAVGGSGTQRSGAGPTGPGSLRKPYRCLHGRYLPGR
jgi:Universal stress protein family